MYLHFESVVRFLSCPDAGIFPHMPQVYTAWMALNAV